MMMKESNRKLILQAMLLLSVAGLGIASYQTYEHYFLTSSVCDISASFSCSTVTESRYGEFPPDSEIATAAYGVVWWIVLIVLIYGNLKKKEWFRPQEFYILLWLLVGLIFVFYLLAVEFYFLPLEIGQIVICPLCTVQHIFIAILLVLIFFILKKPIKMYFKNLFYIKTDEGRRKLNPKPFFVLGTFLIVSIGGYFILGGGKEINYYSFAQCLAEKNITMYGFKACPNCNKQEHIIGRDAFEKHIEGTGRYVKCRPESEANQPIGDRLVNITILSKYKDKISPATTQGELCALMVGTGTPTWIINEQQVSGWKTISELSDLSGCPKPENLREARSTGGGVTPVNY